MVTERPPFGKQDFKYFIGYKIFWKNENFMHILSTNDYILKKFRWKYTYLILITSFKNKFLLNIWKFLEKVSNIIKNKFNSELIYNKKYVTAEKKINRKRGFQCLYAPMILMI